MDIRVPIPFLFYFIFLYQKMHIWILYIYFKLKITHLASNSHKWGAIYALTGSKSEGAYKLQKEVKLGGWKVVFLIRDQSRNYGKHRGPKVRLNLLCNLVDRWQNIIKCTSVSTNSNIYKKIIFTGIVKFLLNNIDC